MLGKVAAMRCASAWGAGLVLAPKKFLEAKGRDDGTFISLSPSLTTSGAQAFFLFHFHELGPAPATYT